MNRRSHVKSRVVLAICSLLLFIYVLHAAPSFPAALQWQYNKHDRPPVAPDEIPNLVHYAQLRRDKASKFKLGFQSFLSVYGAIMYLSPDKIYIHTDHTNKTIEEARTSGDQWTRIILNFPHVVVNKVVAPDEVRGIAVQNIEAKSDFVRWEALYEMGGLYLDWDVLPLRDSKILRKAGFANVVGRQKHGKVNTGCVMSQKGSALSYLMRRDGPIVFDGGWETHAVTLLRDISDRLVRIPGEVLIMDELAFAPGSWEYDDVVRLFAPQFSGGFPPWSGLNSDEEDPILRWDNQTRVADWEMDFSPSYFLHAFKSGRDMSNIPGLGGINMTYILSRDSNFAIAAYPILRHALDAGVVAFTDD